MGAIPEPAGAGAEARDELRAVARELLGADRAPSWTRLAASGWTGLEVPEEFGGAGATFAETAVICGELGRAAARTPYLGSAVLGVGALLELAPCPGRDELLRAVAAGGAVPVAVLPDQADFAPDAADATHLLVVTGPLSPGESDNSKKQGVVVRRPAGPGLLVEDRPVLDETRRLARVRLDDAAVSADAVWSFAGDPDAALARLRDRSALAVACDSLGVAEAALEATVSYVTVREQFGRPVGSFQAVQHACADMLVAVRVSRELVTSAVTALAAGDSDAGVKASMAKSHASASAVDVAGKAMQLHGGIGYTWEGGIHAYLKRAMLNRSLSGSPQAHRRRLAARY